MKGKAAHSAHLPLKNLIKITIFKMMVLHDSLVCDPENWSAYQPFPVVSLLCVWARLYRSCDEGLLLLYIYYINNLFLILWFQ